MKRNTKFKLGSETIVYIFDTKTKNFVVAAEIGRLRSVKGIDFEPGSAKRLGNKERKLFYETAAALKKHTGATPKPISITVDTPTRNGDDISPRSWEPGDSPSRRVACNINGNDLVLGTVAGLAKAPSGKPNKPPTEPVDKKFFPFLPRSSPFPIGRFDPSRNIYVLNSKNDGTVNSNFMVPKEKQARVKKHLKALYDDLNHHARGVFDALANSDVTLRDELYVDGVKVYNEDTYDYVIDRTIRSYLASRAGKEAITKIQTARG
jgi:hypothetical protein